MIVFVSRPSYNVWKIKLSWNSHKILNFQQMHQKKAALLYDLPFSSAHSSICCFHYQNEIDSAKQKHVIISCGNPIDFFPDEMTLEEIWLIVFQCVGKDHIHHIHRRYLVARTELIHGSNLSLAQRLAEHIQRRHLSAEHCVDLHVTSSTNVTFIKGLKEKKENGIV